MFNCGSSADCERWMTFWTGATAVATFALLIAAVVAGITTYLLFRTETRRDNRVELAARMAQANLVAAWPGGIVVDHHTPEGDVESQSLQVVAWIRNASPVPIYNVRLVWLESNVVGEWGVRGDHSEPLLPPDDEPRRFSPDKPIDVPLLDETESEVMDRMRTRLYFRDASGTSWCRDISGELIER